MIGNTLEQSTFLSYKKTLPDGREDDNTANARHRFRINRMPAKIKNCFRQFLCFLPSSARNVLAFRVADSVYISGQKFFPQILITLF